MSIFKADVDALSLSRLKCPILLPGFTCLDNSMVMKIDDFDYLYPEELIAQEPAQPYRILLNQNGSNSEITHNELLNSFTPGDVLVVNNTKVAKCRVFSEKGFEVLFVKQLSDLRWQVLFPSSRLKGNKLTFKDDYEAQLVEKGIPQTIELNKPLDDQFFEMYGEMALPPYIQKQRDERHNRDDDELNYQTQWAKFVGSCAAPTASLHFSLEDLEYLKSRDIEILEVTLHVGLGTFLPVRTSELEHHQMHAEYAHIDRATLEKLQSALDEGRRIWALGTTVARTLESWKGDLLHETADGISGETKLFIYPGYQFQVVKGLLTNFHQPKSTLLALVCAFASRENVFKSYAWAIEREFRLFSYGDLSVWKK